MQETPVQAHRDASSGLEATEAPPRKPRVLLVAEAANPEMVSVPLVGWSSAMALAKVADVHLVTQVRNRAAILRYGLVEDVDFTTIDTEAVAIFLMKVSRTLKMGWTLGTALSSIAQPYFEHLVWKKFKSRIRAGEFDIVHRTIPLTPTAPSLLASRCRRAGVPFILGPLNGGLPWPKGFDHVRRQEREWLSYVRSFYKLLPGYHSTRRDASAIIAGSRDVIEQMPAKYINKCVYVPENAIDMSRFVTRRTRLATRPIRGVFIGRLVPYKGAGMVLNAAVDLIRDGSLRLDIIGDGPEMAELKQIVEREGIGEGVTFLGWVEHTQIADHLVNSDLFIFPSIREFGGGAVLEAMAVGVVPVIVDYGGPPELATEETAYLIPMGNRSKIIERLREVLTAIAKDPTQIEEKSRAAIRRIERFFTWDAKAEQISGIYQWVLGQRPTKPDYSIPLGD
jgi:glycosyltransferase involved in cell wall biosynthesis